MVTLPRAPTNPNEAAAYTMIAMLNTAHAFAIWGCILSTTLPDWVFVFFKLYKRLLTARLRFRMMLVWHILSAAVSGVMALAIAGGLAIHATRDRFKELNEFLCQRDAFKKTYADNRLTAAVTALLFLMFVRLFADRCVAILCGAPSALRATRFGRAADTAMLWWLLSSGSPLAVLQSFVMAVEWCLSRTKDAMTMTKCSHITVRNFTRVQLSVNIVAACFLMHCGGQTHKQECNASKRNSSMVVMHSGLWCVSLIRESLRVWLSV